MFKFLKSKWYGLFAAVLGLGVLISMLYLHNYNVEGTGTWFAYAMELFGLAIFLFGAKMFYNEAFRDV